MAGGGRTAAGGACGGQLGCRHMTATYGGGVGWTGASMLIYSVCKELNWHIFIGKYSVSHISTIVILLTFYYFYRYIIFHHPQYV